MTISCCNNIFKWMNVTWKQCLTIMYDCDWQFMIGELCNVNKVQLYQNYENIKIEMYIKNQIKKLKKQYISIVDYNTIVKVVISTTMPPIEIKQWKKRFIRTLDFSLAPLQGLSSSFLHNWVVVVIELTIMLFIAKSTSRIEESIVITNF